MSDLLISNDSGPLHLAECLRVPTVSFFGPERPCCTVPPVKSRSSSIRESIAVPCLHIQNQKEAPCNGNNICMKLIRADAVFPVVKMLLDGVPIASPFRVYHLTYRPRTS